MTSPDFLHHVWYHNSAQAWLVSAAVAAIVFLVLLVTRRLLVAHMGGLAAKTTNRLDDLFVDLLARTRGYVLLFIALDLATRSLTLTAHVDSLIADAARLVLLVLR